MGWGAVKRAAPQPAAFPALKELADIRARHEEPEEDIIIVAPSKAHKDEMEWTKERARWAPDTANRMITDFVREKALFGELVKFSKKRRR